MRTAPTFFGTRPEVIELPPIALVPGRVYLATTAQVYPEVTSWNGSAGLALRVADQMHAER